MYMYVSVRPEKIIIRFSSKVLKNSGVGAWVNFIFHFIFYYDSLLILVFLYDFSIKRHATSGVLADDVLILGICL